ncbi:unnamed protein product [Adineta steineri]|uniref:Uncharacterized protein n=1 Tax=Adineta steineri TaxID=433720 RepID=A0A815JBQ7_9BILA|nr:unnamed protein product [Adineta steineri]CAF1421021.1 unnamed protein product [Adineta steineri]CAF3728484.1 unnamed protein product [Adineta steineri]CAF3860282.1 unnamed protein product [Adineta steineri]
MPFDTDGKYKPSDEFKKDLSESLSMYLYGSKDKCSDIEYEAMLTELPEIQKKAKKDFKPKNDTDSLDFKKIKEEKKEQMKLNAIPKIIKILQDLRQRRVEQNPLEGDGSTINKSEEYEVAKGIWQIWAKEREQVPRCGIIPLFENQDVLEVLSIMFYKNNVPQCGYPKGEIQIGETIRQCAARHASKELGCNENFIYDKINDNEAILKNVGYSSNLSIEQYYFIVPVASKDMHFEGDRHGVDDTEWCNIYKLPCCKDCQVTQLMHSKQNGTSADYFMVICYDRSNRTSLTQDILKYIDDKNNNHAVSEEYNSQHENCPKNQ